MVVLVCSVAETIYTRSARTPLLVLLSYQHITVFIPGKVHFVKAKHRLH
jgi:hypothetical protein